MITIRQATSSDLETLQLLSRQTFFEAFSSENTPEDMQSYLDKSFNDQQLTQELKNPDSAFYFAMSDQKEIGYLKVNEGAAQTELKNLQALEIERIYVKKEFQDKKVGQLLFEKALELAKLQGAPYIWLGVWEKNLKAIRFYKRNGFVEFDKHIFKVGTDEQTDLLMKIDLS
ncbi:MAG TPA: GNAT family N-acetyltransferase [Bacteroidia bacterium]|jgi:ribosomal protein S18 acetylase RimI-like enzyme|nr:GNAT family N-acetyltransferase [Bacteroidia bacterium]